ncbi:MAG: hypothetical protein IJU69_05790 [Bacteroidales bacterium]|nr:hypothetical protein [Bacteroidales bacterium]
MGVKNFIFNHLPLSVRVKLFEKMRSDAVCGYGEKFEVTLEKAFDTYLTPQQRQDRKLMQELTDDIVKCWLLYRALPYEYFAYDFRNSSDSRRASFMTDIDKNSACKKYTDLKAFQRDVLDKYSFYTLMEPFFGRRVTKVDNSTDKEEFINFALEVKHLFCKLSKGSRGNGAFPADIQSRGDAEDLFSRLTASADEEWVIEQRIVQSAEMAQWNASCVNTVRLPSFITKDGFKVLDPFFRTGRAGSVVDNAGQGGVFAAIDPQTGVLITDGVDEAGHTYPVHPDSGLSFKGWQIPRWQELLQVAEKAHRSIPSHKYIGWDFALTDDGWMLIEGNWGQMLGQYATKVGVRDLFMKYISE